MIKGTRIKAMRFIKRTRLSAIWKLCREYMRTPFCIFPSQSASRIMPKSGCAAAVKTMFIMLVKPREVALKAMGLISRIVEKHRIKPLVVNPKPNSKAKMRSLGKFGI